MAALPATLDFTGSTVTEGGFKTAMGGLHDYLEGLFGADGTKATAISTLGAQPFPSGTLMLFQQTTAPTGWTKQTVHNDKALRVVSGTAGSGGAVAFSTAFGRTATDAYTLTSAQIPAHTHAELSNGSQAKKAGLGGGSGYVVGTLTDVSSIPEETGATGGGGAHSHDIDLRVSYVDLIIASKD